MFGWPCTTVYQYSENNVMNFLLSLLRIKDLYMFPALHDHPQEAHYKWYVVICLPYYLKFLTLLVLFIGGWIGYEMAGFAFSDGLFSMHLYTVSSFADWNIMLKLVDM
jgi:hypothetical protein